MFRRRHRLIHLRNAPHRHDALLQLLCTLPRMSRPALQRCEHYVPGLRSRPWWPPQDLPEAALLEADCDAIAREFEDLFLAGRLRQHPQSHRDAKKPLTKGDWGFFALYTGGLPDVGNLIEAPVAARVLGSMEDSICNPRGVVFFSVLPPRTHIWAHCGPTNTRISLHLGLHISRSALLEGHISPHPSAASASLSESASSSAASARSWRASSNHGW